MIADISTINALVTDWDTVPVEKTAEGIERQMIVGRKHDDVPFQVCAFCGDERHSHPHEQMTLILQGKVNLLSAARCGSCRPETCAFPPHNRHGATMLDEEVVLIDIFSPVREDFLKG